jgi:Flp pilus assembly protein TadB
VSAFAAVAIAVAVAAFGLGLIGPPTVHAGRAPRVPGLEALRRRRDERAAGDRALATLRATQAALRAGLPLPIALRHALDGASGPGLGTYQAVLRSFELNAPLHATVQEIARSLSDRRARLALDALALLSGEQIHSARAAAVLGSVADRIAFDVRLRDEVAASTSGLRVQILLLAALVPGMALYLVATLPAVGATLASPIGSSLLIPAAAALEVAGIVASRAIVRSVSR